MAVKSTTKKYALIVFCLLFVFFFNVQPTLTATTFGESPVRYAYVGGFPIGLELKPKGVIVVGAAAVETELGSVIAQTPLEKGDIIEKINGNEVASVADIENILKSSEDMSAELTVKRGSATLNLRIGLLKEDLTGEKRLGLQIRESVAGIGTVTYVKEDGSFGCLGHPITLENGSYAPCHSGFAYNCKILGYERGVRGKPGELKGAFVGNAPIGTLYKNCKSGVFGKFDKLVSGEKMEIADRRNVSIGKAEIITTIESQPERYSIEIIKTVSQNTVSDKSMVIRVTDKRLLSMTGGILQGMSGSPIIQNGKIVGAVTHVFVSDPTKGYGIYCDWMYQN